MFNSLDRDTVRALADYRRSQLHRDFDKRVSEAQSVMVRRTCAAGFVTWIRRSIGLYLIRAGARVAGTGLQTRIRTQL